MRRTVATYTSLPGREEILEKSITSLLQQTVKLDVIYLTLPQEAERLGKKYQEPSEFLKQHCQIVRIEKDFGPITKIYGALTYENDEKTCIISCDDDVTFPSNFVETLLQKHENFPDSAICGAGAMFSRGIWLLSFVSSIKLFEKWKGFSGFSVGPGGRSVDIAYGAGGVLYTRSMFPPHDSLDELWKIALSDKSLFHNDDVVISGYLSSKRIERRLFLDIPSVDHVISEGALSADFFAMMKRMAVAIEKAKEIGYYQQTEYYSSEETVLYRSIAVVVAILILIFACVFFYLNL